MKLCLSNLTDNAIRLKSNCYRDDLELIVLPETSAAIPSSKQKVVMSWVGGSPASTEKEFLDYEVERQYVVDLSKSSSSRRSLLTMPEDCPWRIYRNQVASSVLFYSSVE